MRLARIAALFSLAAAPAAGEPVLGLPIDCTPGQTCYIQQFVDRDPGPKARDFMCGTLSYDGHKGTDFAVPTLADMRRGVDVLAAVPGVVIGRRDSMADVVYSDAVAETVAGRECGNGVVLRHADGWETQYCHMKSGSVTVGKGDQVARGDVLGQVGLSGLTQFPHVHMNVRQNGEIVDPFDTGALASCATGSATLWDPAVAPVPVPGGLMLAGFAPGVPTFDAITDGTAGHASLPADAAGLVLFALAFGGQAGDVLTLKIDGPDGVLLTQNVILEKTQARFFRAAGKRLTAARWPAGDYVGSVQMQRGSTPLGRRDVTVTIN